jgi:EmrB/QacA subfamily drug resistance transporter
MTEPTEAPPIAPEVYDRRWRILGVLCLSLTIVMVGNSSLNVALPSLADTLGATNSELQWVVDAYALVFAGLLFPAGAIGDRFGRKRTLQTGLVVFLLAAAGAAMADTSAQLIAARAVMGAAAAFVMPSTLSSLTAAFPAEERAKAISTWAGVAAGGAAIGPVLSGFLLEHFWWGSVFLVNVPVIALALVLGRRLLPESRNPAGHPLDIPGAGLAMVAVGALVFAIIQAPEHGWSAPATVIAFALALVAGVGFVAREATAAHPMLPLGLFRDRRFSVASGGISLAFFSMFGTWFLMAQYVQLVLGYSPLQAGLLFLPFSVIMFLTAPQAPRLVGRFGGRNVAAAGFVSIALGLYALSQVAVDSEVWAIYLALVPMAFGMAIVTSPLTTSIMAAVPVGIAGVGSAMNDTTRELGGALGVAVLGSLTTTTFASELRPALDGLPDAARDAAQSSLSAATRIAEGLPGGAGDAVVRAADLAYVHGFHTAATVGAVVILAAAIGARLFLPRNAAVVTAPPRPTSRVGAAPRLEPDVEALAD